MHFGVLVLFFLLVDEAVCLRQFDHEHEPVADTELLRRGQNHYDANRGDTTKSSTPRAFVRISSNATTIGGDGSKPSAEGTRLLCALRDAVEFKAPLWDIGANTKSTVSYRPPLPGKSCATVSNSGAMLLHEYGAEIDGHDFVLRHNRGPTKGFEKHVGSRESIRAGWDSVTFVRQFCASRMANKESSSSAKSVEQADATVYVTANEIPAPECADMLAEKSSLLPTMETFQNVGVNGKQIERFLMDAYGEDELLKGASTTDLSSGGFYGVMLLGYCQYVDFYELAPSTAALDANLHYYLGSLLEVERPTAGGEPWGRGAETNSWHGLMRVEHDFFRRVASTPSEESLKTGKLRIPGLATLTDKDCGKQ